MDQINKNVCCALRLQVTLFTETKCFWKSSEVHSRAYVAYIRTCWWSNSKFSFQSQDGDAKQAEKAEETEERAATAEQQEPDKPETPASLPEDSGKTDAPEQSADASRVTVPAVETSEETMEEEPGKEPEGGPEEEAADQEQDESRMHVLGHDDNIRTKSLEELPADQVSRLWHSDPFRSRFRKQGKIWNSV